MRQPTGSLPKVKILNITVYIYALFCLFAALPGLPVVYLLLQSLLRSLLKELHHSDRAPLRHPQLSYWGH